MERKTKVEAAAGTQDLFVTRKFDLPLELLFKAYTEPDLIEQWMGNKVLKLENKDHGSYQFETTDPRGNVLFRANGSIHKFIPDKNIVRTFEMENIPFPVHLEFLEFEKLADQTSTLTIHIICKSVVDRDNMLKMPFAEGINMAHNQLQKIMS